MQVREHEQIILRVSNFCFLPFELLRNTLPLVTFSPTWLPAVFLCANRTCCELSEVFWTGSAYSSRERVVIHCCAAGSQIVPLSCSVSRGLLSAESMSASIHTYLLASYFHYSKPLV